MKVTIIGGGGRVGSCAAFALQCGGLVAELQILDANKDLAERLALGQVLIRVEDLQLGHEAAALQRKRRTGTHAATAANDCDFHDVINRFVK